METLLISLFFDSSFILFINLCSVLVNFPITKIIISLREIINLSISLSVLALSFDSSSSSSLFIISSNFFSLSKLFLLINSLLISIKLGNNKGASCPAESRIHNPPSCSFSSSAYLILIPFVSTLYPVGISTLTIFDNKYDLPTLFKPTTPIFIVRS